MRFLKLCGAALMTFASLTVSAAEPAQNKTMSLDRDSIIELVSEKTTECRKEKDGSLCANYFSEDGVVVQVMREDGERKDGVWFVDDSERLCILWKGKIKPLCFEVFEQDDGTYNLVKHDKHISTIIGSEDGNPNKF